MSRKKSAIRGDLEKNPAHVVMQLIGRSSEMHEDVARRIREMLRNPELDADSQVVLIGKLTDVMKQSTELATSAAAAFGKKPSAGPGAPALPMAQQPYGETFSPPPPLGDMVPTVATKGTQ